MFDESTNEMVILHAKKDDVSRFPTISCEALVGEFPVFNIFSLNGYRLSYSEAGKYFGVFYVIHSE